MQPLDLTGIVLALVGMGVFIAGLMVGLFCAAVYETRLDQHLEEHRREQQ